MIMGKGQVEHSTMLAKNQSLPVRLMRNLAAGADLFIFLSGIHGKMSRPGIADLGRVFPYIKI